MEEGQLAADIRAARIEDVPALVTLMAEFYLEGGYRLPHDAATKAFMALLGDTSRGRIFLIETASGPVGYMVLTFGFSMEYGGLRGFVDDFFVRPALRGRGIGAAALREVERTCRDLGVRALLAETGAEDHPARGVYARAGLAETGRVVLALPLAPPLHEA